MHRTHQIWICCCCGLNHAQTNCCHAQNSWFRAAYFSQNADARLVTADSWPITVAWSTEVPKDGQNIKKQPLLMAKILRNNNQNWFSVTGLVPGLIHLKLMPCGWSKTQWKWNSVDIMSEPVLSWPKLIFLVNKTMK